MALRIATDAFSAGGSLPVNFTRDGANKSPPLHWEGVPEGTQSLALVVEDPDAPGETFYHWLVYNIPAETTNLEFELGREPELANGIRQGVNDFGEVGWDGPQPPGGKRHQYIFRLYALREPLGLAAGIGKQELLNRLSSEVVLERAEISVFYKSLSGKKRAA